MDIELMDITVTMYPVNADPNYPAERRVIYDATFDKLRNAIDCTTAELVPCMNYRFLMVDENGIGDGKELNPIASSLLGSPIFGDALMVEGDHLDKIPYE